MAGFKSVIGTLWSVEDEFSISLSQSFYKHMLEGGEMRADNAALCLHKALQEARSHKGDDRWNMFYWLPYVHIGI